LVIFSSEWVKSLKPQGVVDLSLLTEERDFQFTPGGVTRMVFHLLRQMLDEGLVEEAHWVSLNPTGPLKVRVNRLTLHHLSLAAEKVKGYGYIKEAIWNILHGIPQELYSAKQSLWQNAVFTHYSRLFAKRINELDEVYDFDLFYIHDFQQLRVGPMLGTLKPKIFRWHAPFDEHTIPSKWKELILNYLDSYDTIIVSCKSYLKALKTFGYGGKAHHIYPYLDTTPYQKTSASETAEYCKRFGIRDNDKIVLLVGRLDPVKGQDTAIRAMNNVIHNVPEAKLVLVGDGSFSSSEQGLGLPKANRWFEELKKLARTLGIEEHVVFSGHLTQKELNAAYEKCDFTILPSVREGFGLVVIESWLYQKPSIVSSRAGVAELVQEGRNSLLFDPDDYSALAERMLDLLLDPELTGRLGINAFATSKKCYIDNGVKEETKIMQDLI
jgi:glycosyltransferase involved in cell wall biosynthesis